MCYFGEHELGADRVAGHVMDLLQRCGSLALVRLQRKLVRATFQKLICSKSIGRPSDSSWDEEGPFCFIITIIKVSLHIRTLYNPAYIQRIQSPLNRLDKGLRKLINLPYSPISFRNCNNMGYHILSSGTSRWNLLYVKIQKN